MTAGSGDVIVGWRASAFVVLDPVSGATLVLLAGALHTGIDVTMAGHVRTGPPGRRVFRRPTTQRDDERAIAPAMSASLTMSPRAADPVLQALALSPR